MKPKPTLTLPTPELMEEAVADFNRASGASEDAVRELFDTYPANNNFNHVLWKVVMLNRIYSTNVFAVEDLANHIVQRAAELDGFVRTGSPKAVDLFSNVILGGKPRNLFSFATKYCNWQNQEAYPIFDSRVGWYLWNLQKQTKFSEHFQRYEFQNYDEFKTVFTGFQRHFHLEKYDVKSLDKFLWLHGEQSPPHVNDEHHSTPAMEAEPILVIDSVRSDEVLHADMLSNDAANRLGDESARRIGLELGLTHEQVERMINPPK